MYEVGIGVIGAGFIGRVHVRAARLVGARVVGVADSDPGRSLRVATELGAEEHFADARALIGHPGISVVHVCTPNDLHRPLVEEALAHGKHVICEKPLATNSADAAGLARMASQARVVAAVPFAYRYHAMVHEARARVLSGAIGPVHLVHGSYLQDWLLTASDGNWRVDVGKGGPSRAFADIGSHWCDLFEWVTGQRIVELTAAVRTVVPKRPGISQHTFGSSHEMAATELMQVNTEDVACLVFRASGDVVGTLTVSQVSAGRKNRLWIEIDGRDASVVFDEEQPEALWIGRRSVNEQLLRDPAELSPDARRVSVLPAGHQEGFLDNFAAFLSDVYGAVLNGGERRYPSFEDGLRATRITEAVLRSVRERAWVKVEP